MRSGGGKDAHKNDDHKNDDHKHDGEQQKVVEENTTSSNGKNGNDHQDPSTEGVNSRASGNVAGFDVAATGLVASYGGEGSRAGETHGSRAGETHGLLSFRDSVDEIQAAHILRRKEQIQQQAAAAVNPVNPVKLRVIISIQEPPENRSLQEPPEIYVNIKTCVLYV